MGFTSTSGCCCFDLKAGGLILGYLSLIWAAFVFFVGSSGIGYKFWYCLFLSSVVVAWLYGIHENKHVYMLAYLIYSVFVTAIYCIFFAVVTFSALFGLTLIDSILQHVNSAAESNFGGRLQANAHSYGSENAANAISLAGGFIFLYWFMVAIVTAINWYYTVVMISLYSQMKAESLEQLPSSTAQNIQVSQMGNFGGYPLPSQAGNVAPQIAQTDCLKFVETTK